MDTNELANKTKDELLTKCEQLGLKKYKSKNKGGLIELIKLATLDGENSVVEKPVVEKPVVEKPVVEKPAVEELHNKNFVVNNEYIQNIDGINYLKTLENNSIDLILTDPPYIISKESGMNTHYNKIKNNEQNNIENVKSEEEWQEYKKKNNIEDDSNKDKYIKYGTIYGKKYCVKTQYGQWDSEFTMEILEKFISEYYNKLKTGGTLIIFFDLWKITHLKYLLEKYKFKQIRFIEWIKTNPQPLNSKTNYLTNCREIALIAIKGTKPTFNSHYDNGVYMFPLQGGKNRFHPTQKSLLLFEELIKKHSNENYTILDTFLGSGTTAIACKNTNRIFKGCELNKEYFDKSIEILNLS